MGELRDKSGDWNSLEHEVTECKDCGLHKSRTKTVFGDGNRNAKLMFIGEAPGADEDKAGCPFVGDAGKRLDKMIIEDMGYKREDAYIANIIKCRPPDNRKPIGSEIAHCIGFIRKQISLVSPDVIVCLGKVATKAILGDMLKLPDNFKLGDVRNKSNDYKDTATGKTIKVIPTYHPSYLLRCESVIAGAEEDLHLAVAELEKTSKNKGGYNHA
ncbi:hypothetical protein RsTz2092_13160 [Deferribacterales bacterium RsTz2092]|nr:hypothetical protein AGMMS49941_10410 [Deferribacterales bacterium]GHU87204.1 hypothetical protein AGMMS49941_10440 [Deferribacterales bacterium]